MARTEVTWAAADTPLASPDALMAAADMPEATVQVERWKQAIRLRGPNLPHIVQISTQARRKDALSGEIVRDRVKFIALTLQHCIVSPKLDAAQATLLAQSKNPVVLEALTDFAWNELLSFSWDEIADIVADVSQTPLDEAADAGDSDGNEPL